MDSKRLDIAIYARVSTDKQEAENQIEKLKQYAKVRGWNVVGVYKDEAVSGRKASRPQLNRMKEDIRAGKIRGVLVWKLDRLGRSLRDLITLTDFFRVHNCEFISYNNNIDTSTAEGKLLFHILASFAEFEADLISERTKLAYEVKKIHASAIGQKVKWGRKRKVLLESEIDTVKHMREEGFGWRRIADEINRQREDRNKHLPKDKQLPKVSYNKLRRYMLLQNGKDETG